MKKTGKILFGVLSVSSLVGTGFAAWIVNNGFQAKQEVTIDPTVDSEIINKYSTVDLIIDKKDTNLKFAPQNEDLTLGFNLKGNPEAYNQKFDNVSDDYIPDVTIKTEIIKKGNNLDVDLENFKTEVSKYILLPETINVSYTDWLNSSKKDTGHDVNLTFKWATENNVNPQVAWGNLADAKTRFEGLVNTLKEVQFKVTFTIGRLATMHTLTLNETLNGKVELEDSNGNKLINNQKYREGTSVKVIPTADPYYKLQEIKVNNNVLQDPYTFTLNESNNIIDVKFTNKVVTCEITDSIGGKIKVLDQNNKEILNQQTLFSGSKFKVETTLDEGYIVDKLTVKQGEEILNNVDGFYTLLDNENSLVVSATYKISAKSKLVYITTEGVIEPTFIDYNLNTEVTKGTTIVMNSLTLKPNYKVLNVKLNDQIVTSEPDGTYKLVLINEGENILKIEVIQTGKLTINQVKGANIVVKNSENTEINSETDIPLNTNLIATVSLENGYKLNKVLLDGVELNKSLEKEEYPFTFNKVEGHVLTVEVSESFDSIDTLIQAGSTIKGQNAKIKGQVLTTNDKGFYVIDNSNYIYVFENKIPTVKVGDTVKIEGTISSYSNRNQFNNKNLVITPLEEKLDNIKTYNLETLTYPMISELITTNKEGYVQFGMRATSTNEGVIDKNTEYSVQFPNYSGLEIGKYYEIKGYLAGFYDKKLAVTIENITLNDTLNPTSIKSLLTAEEKTLSVNEILDLTNKFELAPSYIVELPTITVEGTNEGIISIDGLKITGLKEGTVNIKLTLGTTSSEIITLNVIAPKLNSITLNELNSIKANTPTELTITCDPIDYIPNNVVYTVTNETGTAEIVEGNKLKGLTVGTVKVYATVNDIKSNEITVNIEEAPSFVSKTENVSLANLTGGVGDAGTQFEYVIGDFKITSIKGNTNLREGDSTVRLYAKGALKIEFNEPLATRNIKSITINYDSGTKYQKEISFSEGLLADGTSGAKEDVVIGAISNGQAIITLNKEFSTITLINNGTSQVRIASLDITYNY